MVNENAGRKYEPRAVYNRKLARSIIRSGVAKKFGNHHVSKVMSQNFKTLRGNGE